MINEATHISKVNVDYLINDFRVEFPILGTIDILGWKTPCPEWLSCALEGT